MYIKWVFFQQIFKQKDILQISLHSFLLYHTVIGRYELILTK